jgi:hypothetical protein
MSKHPKIIALENFTIKCSLPCTAQVVVRISFWSGIVHYFIGSPSRTVLFYSMYGSLHNT